jgi:hypothetical protein
MVGDSLDVGGRFHVDSDAGLRQDQGLQTVDIRRISEGLGAEIAVVATARRPFGKMNLFLTRRSPPLQ